MGDFLGLYDAMTNVAQVLAAGMQNTGKTVYERRIYAGSSGAGWGDLSGAVRSNGWHRFDIYYDSANYAAFYVDGVKQYENSGVTSGYTLKYLRTGEQSNSGTSNGYLDDIAVITNPRLVTFSAPNGSISLTVGTTAFSAATGYYDGSEILTLTATPAAGYHFVNWTSTGGWSSASASTTYIPEAGSPTVTANFSRDGNPVTVTACPTGSGTVTGANWYTAGNSVTVTATPNAGYTWANWTDDSCSGTHVVSTSQSYNFTMPASGVNLYAHFVPISYNLTRIACAGGTVSGPNGPTPSGTPVTVVATPDPGYCFLGWTTDGCGGSAYVSKDASYSFNMPASNYSLSANFGKAMFIEDFESYNTSGTSFDSLDKNDSVGPNQAPNGSGNPWWGPNPPNGRIDPTKAHSGGKSLWGTAGNCRDFYNLQYRLNSGSPFTGNIYMDWWFYDPFGSGGSTTNFCGDYSALSYYTGIPTTTDYPSPVPNPMTGSVQQLAIGMSDDLAAGYIPSKYQIRIAGDAGGYHNGWFNTSITRSVGWHHARVVVGPKKTPSGTNDVIFYIDNMLSPVLGPRDSVSTNGYNIIETNTIMPAAGSCSSSGGCVYSKYFHYSSVDDISFGAVPAQPGAASASNIGTGQITWNWIDNSSNEDGFNVWDSAGVLKGTAPAGAASLTETGLTANTQYSRWVDSFITQYSGTVDGSRVALNPAYTLATSPVYGTSGNGAVSCNNGAGSSSITYTTGTATLFSATNGFGTGMAKASKYLYIWDNSLADPVSWASASQWASGQLSFTPTPIAGTNYYLHLRACNGDGVANPTSLPLGPYVYQGAASLSRITDAWALSDGVSLKLSAKAVSAALAGSTFWIEEDDRTAAMKVVYSGTTAALIDRDVNVYGTLDSSTRPRTLIATLIEDLGPASLKITPLGMILRSLGGSEYNSKTPGVTNGVGRYNLGILVRVAGKVMSYDNTTDPTNKYFIISDGSSSAGVKVKCGPANAPTGGVVKVTGVVGAENTTNGWVPVLIIREAGDVAPI